MRGHLLLRLAFLTDHVRPFLQLKVRYSNQPILALCSGGGSGIRTPDTFQYAGFQDRCIQPLCQTSNKIIKLKPLAVKARVYFVKIKATIFNMVTLILFAQLGF